MKLPNIFEKEIPLATFPAGEPIFIQGDSADVMYIVKEGEVEILIHDRVVETIGPDGIFGEMALIDTNIRSATVRAKTDCALIPIHEKQFIFMVHETPFFAIEVMRVMAARLRRQSASS